jgi:hypothetical protein
VPSEVLSIVITNSPTSAKRVVQCHFDHDGIAADIVIPDAFDPEISPGSEHAKAERLLASLAAALGDAIGD